ncbi:MAG: T9SS type A sorting domain-containing protein [Bacteroidales bacterium]|nr:T9SS type A sorting domain-containing protein [Bacteroidales bacterium]
MKQRSIFSIAAILLLSAFTIFGSGNLKAAPIASADTACVHVAVDSFVTACDTVVWYGQTISTSGDYPHTIENAAAGGCDSIYILKLTIINSESESFIDTVCSPTQWYDTLISETGVYSHRIHGVASNTCDSIYTLTRYVGHDVVDTVVRMECESITIDTVTYTHDTVIISSQTLTPLGCDNIQYLSMNIGRRGQQYYDTIIGCDFIYFKRQYKTSNFTLRGSYIDVYGCDSNVLHVGIVHHSSTGRTDTTVCDSLVWGGKTFLTNCGDTTVTIKNVFGCDSVVTIDTLIINISPSGDTFATFCDSMTWYGRVLKESGRYAQSIVPNPEGCDSVSILYLTVNQSTHSDSVVVECDSFYWNNAMRYRSGYYPVRLPMSNAQGCDTSRNLDLTIHYFSHGDTNANVCDSINWYGNHLIETGRTTTTLFNQYGCDSLLTLRLKVRYSSRRHEYAEACGFFMWRGYRVERNGETGDTIVNSQGCDSVILLHLTLNPLGTGALNGVFQIGDEHFANFSMGNLQYMPSNDRWRFAPMQFDYVGAGNSRAAEDYQGWIDLFGWATSGYHNPADQYNTYYAPYSIVSRNVDNDNSHGYGPSVSCASPDLTEISSNYDWGMFAHVSNGGEAAGQWRTLTDDEWQYLLFSRPNAISKRAMATVAGINGVVLLPESWILPSDCRYTAGNNNGFVTNVYSTSEWNSMELAGAVFLPAAGVRYDTNVTALTQNGIYWSVTHYDQERAYAMLIEPRRVSTEPFDRSVGRSVRLVQDINGVDLPCTTYGDTSISAIDSVSCFGRTFYQSGDYQHRLVAANSVGCDSVVAIHLDIHSALSVPDAAAFSKCRTYAQGRNVIVEDAQGLPLRIYDVTGRQIVNEGSIKSSKASYQMPTKGIYMLKIGKANARKLIVR